MNRSYDKLDNDTYQEVLGNTPHEDAHLHMFRDPAGRVSRTDRNGTQVMGHFSTETTAKARDAVLRFASPKVTGLKLIKTIQLKTLLPMSLVHRHQLDAENLTHTQATPIFYDTVKEKFVVLMDERFLRDMSLHELKLDMEIYEAFRERVDAYPPRSQSTGSVNLGMLFDSVEEVRKSFEGKVVNSAPSLALVLYQQYRLRQSEGKKVIIVSGLAKTGEKASLIPGVNVDSSHALSTSAYRLEFLVAYQFGNQYYPAKPDGTLDQTRVFRLSKARHQSPQAGLQKLGVGDASLLVLEYSDQQHALLLNLSSRLSAFHDEVMSFLKESEQCQQLIDSPLGANGHSRLLERLVGPT